MTLHANNLCLLGTVAPGWERIQEYCSTCLPQREGLGMGLCVHHAGEVVVDVWMGQSSENADWHPDRPVDMGPAVVGIGTLCMLLLRKHGELDLDDYVIKYWPEFADDDVKINHLLSGIVPVSCGTQWWCVCELVRRVDPGHRTIDVFVTEELLPTLNLDVPVALTIPEPLAPNAPIHWAGATARGLAAIYCAFMKLASNSTDMPLRCAVIGSGGSHADFDVETESAHAILTNNSNLHSDMDVVSQQLLSLRNLVSEIAKEINQSDFERHQSSEMGLDDVESYPSDNNVGRLISRTSTTVQSVMQSDTSMRKTITGMLTPKTPSPTCPSCIQMGGFCGRCSQWRQTLLDDIITEPEVLRGVPASTVLWRMGYWIRSGSKPSDEEGQKMHKLSFPVERITRFLSHSWHANASIKVMALLCFYNSQFACATGLSLAFLVSMLQRLGAIPSMGVSSFDTTTYDADYKSCPWKETRGMYAILAYIFGYYLVFTFGMRMRDRVALAYPDWPHNRIGTAFLDKLCIHQTDPIKKQKGINAIGAFLIQSERVTILWDATYFTRLWCVFEVAVFRRLNPAAIIEFVPITLGKLEIYLHLAACFSCLLLSLLLIFMPEMPPLITTGNPTACSVCFYEEAGASMDYQQLVYTADLMFFSIIPMGVFYQWRRHVHFLQEVPKILCSFSAKKANCFSETDRKFVESVIIALYDSLENFDEHVQGSLASKLNGVVGTDSVPMLPLGLLYRSMCIPLLVSVGLDHGLFWDAGTLPSLIVTLVLVWPGCMQLLSKMLASLPPTRRPKWDFLLVMFFWFPAYGLFDRMTMKITLFEGLTWGLLRRHRNMDQSAIFFPFDIVNVLFFAVFLLVNKFWSKTPRTDQGLLQRKTAQRSSMQ